GINSYSNYNYTNTFSNTTSNTKSSNAIANNNLVSDKSQAVDKILGYGVDKEGFFTSDFNEAAGLPKDYKIYADGLNNFVNNFIKRQPFYSQIDIAKTIGNAYNSFSSFVKDKGLGESFQEQDLKNLSQKDGVNYWQELQSDNAFIWKLTDENIADLGSNKYQIHDNKISKGGALIAFFINNLSTIKGQTTLLGKLAGLNSDTDNNEIKEFLSFMNKNPLKYSYEQDGWGNPMGDSLSIWNYINRAKNLGDDKLIKTIKNLGDEYNKLINSNMSLEEFKTKYLDFKQRHDEFVKSLEEAEKAKGVDYSNPLKNTNNKETSEEGKEKPFKPIQAESKNKETYKDDNTRSELVKKLLKDKFSTSKELELLFGMKFSDDSAGEFNKILSLNSAPKSIDIKA
ncbi:Cj0814 family flagellar-dependent secreted protein, partial [Campylobacter jejuni]|uniref:Cj0814 family flagellar-dependent secreted protein n=1 Tax=Campylobacter jejuni TaxID=197 RepID=UPI002241E683